MTNLSDFSNDQLQAELERRDLDCKLKNIDISAIKRPASYTENIPACRNCKFSLISFLVQDELPAWICTIDVPVPNEKVDQFFGVIKNTKSYSEISRFQENNKISKDGICNEYQYDPTRD